MRVARYCVLWVVVLSVWAATTAECVAQLAATPKPAEAKVDVKKAELPEIPDEPKTIDPATLMPAKLTARAKVDLSSASLTELVAWLREEQKLVVLLNQKALADADVLASEPVSDWLADEPIYLLLDRLRSLKLGWYYENEVLYITSAEEVENRLATVPYNIGDLLDAGYEADSLEETIESTVAASEWDSVGGSGSLTFIGDVMFVRQTDAIHREVQGLLAALRKHARQTFILDPPKHHIFRQQLDGNVSVDFVDMPLEAAVKQLSESTGVDIRLNLTALRGVRIREREPVTVRLADRKLRTVLQAMIMDLNLSWTLRDGVLWITTPEEVKSLLKTAVYDVRDLCRDADESDALTEAITSQADAQTWDEVGGSGSICFAKPGTMVIRNEERVLATVLDLLETYRTALRASKPRQRDVVDPKEVITVYYRMHANMADDLLVLLRTLVEPESWSTTERPDAPGHILRADSTPALTEVGGTVESVDQSRDARTLVASRAVLIITQTRETHDKIAKVIRRVESGDSEPGMDAMGSGMGGMGGGFGGGFFSIPAKP